MEKIFLLAALLLSSSAQAETYVCESEVWITLNATDGSVHVNDWKSENRLGGTLIIDTSRGFKNGVSGSWSELECKNSGQAMVTCVGSSVPTVRTEITITENNGRLSYLYILRNNQPVGIFESGYCGKI